MGSESQLVEVRRVPAGSVAHAATRRSLRRGDAFRGFGRPEQCSRDHLGVAEAVVDAHRGEVDEEALRRRHGVRFGLAHRVHDLSGRRIELVGFDHHRDESRLERSLRVEQLARQQVAAGRSRRHAPLAQDSDHRRCDADPHLAERERRAGRCNDDVGRGDETESTCAHVAVQSGDDGLRIRPQRAEDLDERHSPRAR